MISHLLIAKPPTEVSTENLQEPKYNVWLNSVRRLVTNQLEQTAYEEETMRLLGPSSYELFGIDELILQSRRQVSPSLTLFIVIVIVIVMVIVIVIVICHRCCYFSPYTHKIGLLVKEDVTKELLLQWSLYLSSVVADKQFDEAVCLKLS